MESFMKISHIQTPLVIAVCFLLFLFPSYLCCSSLAEAKIFRADISFENADRDDSVSDSQSEYRVFLSGDFSAAIFPYINLVRQTAHFLPQVSFLDQETFILRC